MVLKGCLATWTEPDRGIVGLGELGFLGVGGLPVVDELEPLVQASPSLSTFRLCSWLYQSIHDHVESDHLFLALR